MDSKSQSMLPKKIHLQNLILKNLNQITSLRSKMCLTNRTLIKRNQNYLNKLVLLNLPKIRNPNQKREMMTLETLINLMKTSKENLEILKIPKIRRTIKDLRTLQVFQQRQHLLFQREC